MGSQEEGKNGMFPSYSLSSTQVLGTWQSSRSLIMPSYPTSLAWGPYTLTSNLSIFPIRQLALGGVSWATALHTSWGCHLPNSLCNWSPQELCSVQLVQLYTAALGLGTLKDEGAMGTIISLQEPWAPNLPPHLSQHPYPLDLTQKAQCRSRFRWQLLLLPR